MNPAILFSLNEDEHGGVIAPVHQGLRLTQNLVRYGYYLNRVIEQTKFKFSEAFVSCEIGAGYGGFARLLKRWYPRATCILLDLPETLMLASFYLGENYPAARIGTIQDFGDMLPIKEHSIRSYDFILLPWWYIERLPTESVGIYFNFFSLQEMTQQFVDYYIKNTERTLGPGGYFYFENRLFSPERYGGTAFSNYPFDGVWNIVYSKNSYISLEQLRTRGYVKKIETKPLDGRPQEISSVVITGKS